MAFASWQAIGSSIEAGTLARAARWTTASTPSTAVARTAGIGHRALDEVDVEALEVGPRAGGEVVEDDHAGDPGVRQRPPGQVRADEPRPAGDQQGRRRRRAVVWVHPRHSRGRRDRRRPSGEDASGTPVGDAPGARAATGMGGAESTGARCPLGDFRITIRMR